jgi:diguanylate cyclase (GGDEF)-like protein
LIFEADLEAMSIIIVVSGSLLLLVMLMLSYRFGKSVGQREGQEAGIKEKDATYYREILSRDREIRELQRKIDTLNELTSQYLAFMLKVPTVIQRLNSMMKLEEIIESITTLIKDIIPTSLVHIYLYNPVDETFTMAFTGSRYSKDDRVCGGMKLIIMAARDKMIRFQQKQADTEEEGSTEPVIRMAVPMIFRERLVGVIGIGKTTKPVANESNLMRMIADIAAVALVNQATLGEAKQQANTDALTGISNRNYFIQTGQIFVDKAIRENGQISIFLFDIDHFKHYNDTNGHGSGDRILVQLASLVNSITRKTAVFARYGGEEFVVMLSGISKREAYVYAERVRETIAQHPFAHGERQPLGCISISGGVATFPDDGDTLAKTIQCADEALYAAKEAGRNSVFIYNPDVSVKQISGDAGENGMGHLSETPHAGPYS